MKLISSVLVCLLVAISTTTNAQSTNPDEPIEYPYTIDFEATDQFGHFEIPQLQLNGYIGKMDLAFYQRELAYWRTQDPDDYTSGGVAFEIHQYQSIINSFETTAAAAFVYFQQGYDSPTRVKQISMDLSVYGSLTGTGQSFNLVPARVPFVVESDGQDPVTHQPITQTFSAYYSGGLKENVVLRAPDGFHIKLNNDGSNIEPVSLSGGSVSFYIARLSIDEVTVPSSISISSYRFAQLAFNPSLTSGLSNDLVADKPYAVEVGLSSENIPDELKNSLIHVDLLKDGIQIASSPSFRVSDIVEGSKIYMFDTEREGRSFADIKLRLFFETPETEIKLQGKHEVLTYVSYTKTKLNLFSVAIKGCASISRTCFKAPLESERIKFENEGVAYAQAMLPMSRGGLTLQSSSATGSDITDSIVEPTKDSITLDIRKVYFQKHSRFADIGVGVVTEDYFVKQGIDQAGSLVETAGIYFANKPGVILVRPEVTHILAHELYHALNAKAHVIAYHGPSSNIEGIGTGPSEMWIESGYPLGGQRFLGSTKNLMSPAAESYDNPYDFMVDTTHYNAAFRTLASGAIDPDVILVGGIIDQNGKSVDFQFQRMSTYLDPSPQLPLVLVEGLDSSGKVVSSTMTDLLYSLTIDRNDGTVEERPLTNAMYLATLPDTGNISATRISIAGTTITTQPVQRAELGLKEIISGLTASNFKGKTLAQRLLIAAVKVEYSEYLRLKSKNQNKLALVALNILRETLKAGLNNQIQLSTGKNLSLQEILTVINAEKTKLK